MIERSLSYRRIKKLTDWSLIVSSKYIYLVEVINGKDKGVWSFFAHSDDPSYTVHVDMQKDFRGKKVIESARRAFKWIFDNTKADFIKAEILESRKDVCYMANYFGMQRLNSFDGFNHFKLMR